MRQVYITGAYGILGKHVLDSLATHQLFDEITGIIRNEDIFTSDESKEDAVINFNIYREKNKGRFDFISYDEFYEKADKETLSDCTLIHLAFARKEEAAPMLASIRLLEMVTAAAQNLDIRAIINISSQSIYDPYREEAAKETDLPAPAGLYGLAKYYSECYLKEWGRQEGRQIINLRLASLIGPEFKQRITSRLLKQAIHESRIEISSNDEKFSFLHVDDAASMVSQIAANKENATHDTYNLGSEEAYSLVEVSSIIASIFQRNGLDSPAIIQKKSTGPQYNNCVALDRLTEDFHLSAGINLLSSIQEEFKEITGEKE